MKSIELFAGIGGIALAAEWAGIETVAFCERDSFCQKVLKKHWPDIPIFDDVCTLNRQVLEEKGVIEPGGTVDIISGGFPCQPYSIAGKRRGKEDDRDLWPEMFRIIKEVRPTWVVGENVANFVNMELDRTLFDLESIGYTGGAFVIPACAVDAKHRRDRTFVVAYSDSIGRDNRFDNRKKRQIQIKQKRGIEENQWKRNGRVNRSGEICSILPNSNSQGLEGSYGQELESQDFTRLHQIGATWPAEPNVGRVANGVPNRVDRIRALGNAVVPQQIYPIFKYIVEIERGWVDG